MEPLVLKEHFNGSWLSTEAVYTALRSLSAGKGTVKTHLQYVSRRVTISFLLELKQET